MTNHFISAPGINLGQYNMLSGMAYDLFMNISETVLFFMKILLELSLVRRVVRGCYLVSSRQ